MPLLFPTTTEFLESWPAEVARGRKNFVLRHGMGWAAIGLALIWFANWALGWDHYPWSGRMPALVIVLEVVLIPLGGILFALLMWRQNNRRYRELSQDPGFE